MMQILEKIGDTFSTSFLLIAPSSCFSIHDSRRSLLILDDMKERILTLQPPYHMFFAFIQLVHPPSS